MIKARWVTALSPCFTGLLDNKLYTTLSDLIFPRDFFQHNSTGRKLSEILCGTS